MCTAIVWIVFGFFYGVDFNEILTISVIVTLNAYAIGDLLLLRYFNNAIATASDFVLSFLIIWFLASLTIEAVIPIVTASFISALLISTGEWFFHNYLEHQLFQHNTKNDHTGLATEMAEEPDVHNVTKQNKRDDNL